MHIRMLCSWMHFSSTSISSASDTHHFLNCFPPPTKQFTMEPSWKYNFLFLEANSFRLQLESQFLD
jgi:hypothetical protein